MKFKLNTVATAALLGTLLGCAPLLPDAPLPGSALAPSRGQAGTMPVKVVQASAVTQATSSSDALYTLGRTAHGAGQIALAGQHYVQTLKMAPDHVGALNGLAVIYAQTDRTDEALKLFARASALAPISAHIRNNTGYALMRDGRLDEAEVALNKARELDPSNAQTQQNLALLASAKAKHQSAGQALQSESGDPDGPRLVVVAPNVFELQAPTRAAAEVVGPAQGTSAPSGKDRPAGAVLHGVRLEVSNGVGINKLARRTADRLATDGVVTARLTNALPYRQIRTEIQFVAGQSLAVQTLQSRMPVATRAVPVNRLSAGVQLRLVLGRDMAGRAIAAWLDTEEKQQLATSIQGGWRWS